VSTRYCITRTSGNKSRLTVTSDLSFTKSLFGFTKKLISNSTHNGLKDYTTSLLSSLRAQSVLSLSTELTPSNSNESPTLSDISCIEDDKSEMTPEKEIFGENIEQQVIRIPLFGFAFMSLLCTSLVLFIINAYLVE